MCQQIIEWFYSVLVFIKKNMLCKKAQVWCIWWTERSHIGATFEKMIYQKYDILLWDTALIPKCDLKDQRQVSKEDGEAFAVNQSLNGFYEVSAKTCENIHKYFDEIIIKHFKESSIWE